MTPEELEQVAELVAAKMKSEKEPELGSFAGFRFKKIPGHVDGCRCGGCVDADPPDRVLINGQIVTYDETGMVESVASPPEPQSSAVVLGDYPCVWVAVAVSSRVVQVRSELATEPLTGGRMGIFNRPQTETTEMKSAEVLGVYTDKQIADRIVEEHRGRHPNLQCEYTVSEHAVGSAMPQPAEPQEQKCILCGSNASTTYCDPCQQKRWQQMRDSDPEFERMT